MDVREGQYIVSKDRDRILARWKVDMSVRGNQIRWTTITEMASPLTTRSGDPNRKLPPVEHEMVIDYQVPGITIWRYIGDAEQAAFDKTSWFEKL